MRKVRENILVASGDQAIFAADTKVFNSKGKTNVNPGQIVFWDPISNESLSLGEINSIDRIVISVGQADGTLRSNFGEYLYPANIQAATAEPPACGVPEIWDLFFENIDCAEEFAIKISAQDNETENQYPYNKPAVFTYSVKTEDCACDSCDSGIDDIKLACALRDQINGTRWNDLAPDRKSVYQRLDMGDQPFFEAHVLYGGGTEDTTNFVYCINPTDGTCTNCVNTGASFDVTQIVANAVSTPFEIAPGANGHLVSNLDALVDAINDVLGNNGHAVITKGAGAKDADGACCPWRLEVNTCHTDFELRDAENGAIATCASGNPFDAVDIANTCTNCGAGATKTYAAGIRIIAKPVTYDCGCYPPNPPKGAFYRKLEVYPYGGFECSAAFVRKLQGGALPDNFGYLWQWREYASANGGRGRGHDQFHPGNFGPLRLPLNNRSRINSTTVDCETSYCSYILEHTITNYDSTIHGHPSNPRGRTVILIPSEDTTTTADFETFINDIIVNSACPTKYEISCNNDYAGETDQDQIEGEFTEEIRTDANYRTRTVYPDANGRILH